MRSRPRSRSLGAVVLLAALAVTSVALGMTPEEEATATRLMREGIAARERGDLAEAERAFEAAHAIADLPSSGIALAKVLAQRGQLLRALQVVNAVLRLERTDRWSVASVEGYQEAIALRPQLEARIPSLVVEVEGGSDASVAVSVDGSRLRPPVIGVPRQMDPGGHRVVVEREGQAPHVTEVVLAEGEREVVRVPAPRASSAVGPTTVRAATGAPPVEAPVEASGGRPLLVTGLVVGGVGVLGLSAGLVTGLIADSKESELEPSCPNGVCPPALADELHSAETYALAANVFYVAGGVLAAAGITLVAIDLGAEEPRAPARARLRLGPGFVGVEGSF